VVVPEYSSEAVKVYSSAVAEACWSEAALVYSSAVAEAYWSEAAAYLLVV
jgi:hypothetical protein